MKRFLVFFVAFLAQTVSADQGTVYLRGITDSTLIGNVNDRLSVDSTMTVASAVMPHINRTDASGAKTATANTGTLDTAGFGTLSVSIDVTAVSGTLPTMDIELQASDDANNWTVLYDTQRFTTTGNTR